jgi:predicted nucleic acid-binding protein
METPEYVVDTVALVRYLSKAGKVGKKALAILEAADNDKAKIVIPMVVLVEVFYLSKRARISVSLKEVIKLIEQNSNYRIVDLDLRVLMTAEKINSNLDLHDHLIASTAKYLKLPLLTCDSEIIQSKVVQTIWS